VVDLDLIGGYDLGLSTLRLVSCSLMLVHLSHRLHAYVAYHLELYFTGTLYKDCLQCAPSNFVMGLLSPHFPRRRSGRGQQAAKAPTPQFTLEVKTSL